VTTLPLLDELEQRGLLEQVTHRAELAERLASGRLTAYCGFDPTATSLHVGNLVPIMVLAHLQRRGHRPIAIVGGATGMIGDPSGRDSERSLLTNEEIQRNCDAIRAQLGSFLEFGGDGALLLDNNDWIGPITFVEWLRDVGKYFSVNYMIAKESVRKRLEEREQGISYTEFSYMLLQAFDFAYLNAQYGCALQIGGNDQWGNITAGIDLVHKRGQGDAFGLTVPLMTTSTGEKFGKSAGNSVWLSAERTPPYQFYQYWLRTDDRDAGRWLRAFTFLDLEEIAAIEAAHAAAPEKRLAQARLATEVTRLVHGDAGVAAAERATAVLFGAEISGLSDADLAGIFADVPSSVRARADLDAGLPLVDALTGTLCESKSQARRLIAQGGVYVNNRRIEAERDLTIDDLATETSLVLRSGKKSYHVLRFA
jgi:tyrosyl-tRNA synthetase